MFNIASLFKPQGNELSLKTLSQKFVPCEHSQISVPHYKKRHSDYIIFKWNLRPLGKTEIIGNSSGNCKVLIHLPKI
jgi:hypothetical protein